MMDWELDWDEGRIGRVIWEHWIRRSSLAWSVVVNQKNFTEDAGYTFVSPSDVLF